MISLKSIASFLYVNDKKVLTEGYDNDWDGTPITDQQALRDFYGNQTITVQGANFSAKSYPDGSIVGSTDNGEFKMCANGNLDCIGGISFNLIPFATQLGTSGLYRNVASDGVVNLPITFVGAYRGYADIGSTDFQDDNFIGIQQVKKETQSELRLILIRINNASSTAVCQWQAKGKWKS